MPRSIFRFLGLVFAVCTAPGYSRAQVDCSIVDGRASSSFGSAANSPAQCTTRMSNGFAIPDPNCTPGAINPMVTLDVLQDPRFRTRCIRDKATSAQQKATIYDRYGLDHPVNNNGQSQTCELDHLVPLEIGGADTLDNIWPQCGPPGVVLFERFFKQKDVVETYLARQVRDGVMALGEAQRGIATDWTQYLAAASLECPAGKC